MTKPTKWPVRPAKTQIILGIGVSVRAHDFVGVVVLRLMYNKIEPQHDKTNKMSVHPAKTQISLGIRPV